MAQRSYAVTLFLSTGYRRAEGRRKIHSIGTLGLLASANRDGTFHLPKMIPVFILGFSLLALVRFAIAQWRLILVSAASHQLSGSLQTATGIDGAAIGPRDFGTLKGFCEQLPAESRKTSSWLKEVSLYYRIIALVEKLPSLSLWANREMQLCSRYAAVVLDQNMAMNLDRRLAAGPV